jgi:tryptophanyl-tRNA synthetase
MITDPEKIKLSDLGHPEICVVFDYHKMFNKPELSDIEKRCRNARLGCVACKQRLSEILIKFFQEFRERRKCYENNTEQVWNILEKGSHEAREVAKNTLHEVKKAMKIDYA